MKLFIDKLTYFFFRAFTAVFSRMPFHVLYVISDVLFFLIYRVAGYRKKVVYANLRNSFPERTEQELAFIARNFYHHLGDLIVESVKAGKISEEEIVKRFIMKRSGELEDLYRDGRSAIVVAGHYNNWEWPGIAAGPQMMHKPVGFYKPLTNQYVDGYMKKTRVKGRSALVSITNTVEVFKTDWKEPAAFYMIADQSPSNARLAYWVKFMNQDTATLHGPEKYARIYNMPVFYVDIKKVKRGYYETEFILICANPSQTKTGEITQKFMQILEEKIRENPQYYLWSHRRWKHTPPLRPSPPGEGKREGL
jgi:KDO2-lipid IV(A) lauroyltransferase